MKQQPVYETIPLNIKNKIQYFFTSTGNQTIHKLIEYFPVSVIEERTVYNLGFGDYDAQNATIIDDTNSNNGDMYIVFNTVLNTIPLFFQLRPDDLIMVSGSDGHQEFISTCKPDCRKQCDDTCKNFQRRIKIYRYFLDKNFDDLCEEFIFFGRNRAISNLFVQYIPNKHYDDILVFKKINLNL